MSDVRRRAAVVYRSHTGNTRRYAEAIADHLRSRGVEVSLASIGDCDLASLGDVDLLLLGCWTSGLFVIRQQPDGPWTSFARALPKLDRPRVGLFTTYTLATGSMFARMRELLAGRVPAPMMELKSRNSELSATDRAALDQFVAGG